MKVYKKIFRLIETLIENGILEKLENGKILGVEIPNSKKKYYASVISHFVPEAGIMIFEGQKGLLNLRELFKEAEEPFDLIPRLNFIGVFFEEEKEFLTPFDLSIQEYNPYGDYDGIGFPRLFRKNDGELEKPIDDKDVKIIQIVLEQLVEDSLRKLQSVDLFSEETRITMRKKNNNKWKRSIEKVSFSYDFLQVNEMQVYPLKKQSTKIFQTWHLGLLYHMEPVYKEENSEELIYPRGIFILDAEESLVNHSIHEGADLYIEATKDLVEETINDLKVRPIKIITDEEAIYYIFKNYFKALDIEIFYDPYDEILHEFKAFNYEGMESHDDDLDLGMEDLFYTYLESKGILPEGINKISDENLDEIMKEFQEIMKDITTTVEESINLGETIPDDAHMDLIKDLFLNKLMINDKNKDQE